MGKSSKHFLSLVLLVAFGWSLTSLFHQDNLLHRGGMDALVSLGSAFLQPDLSRDILDIALVATLRTFSYAITSISLSLLVAFPLALLASGHVTSQPLVRTATRRLLGAMRGIHELIWAWFFVAAIGLSPFAAILALAIPYTGSLGRIWADQLEDIPRGPLLAAETSGGSKWQVIFFAVVPQGIGNMVSYGFYRLECALRSSAILSFVGLGGLGHEIHLSLSDLRFNEAATFLYALIFIVVLVDRWSAYTRRGMVH